MRDDVINRKFAASDKYLKEYIDLKVKAAGIPKKLTDRLDEQDVRLDKQEKLTRVNRWIGKHPGWAILIFLVVISAGIAISHRTSIKQIIEATTGIRVFDDGHDTVTNEKN